MKPHYFLTLPLTLALVACNDSGSSSSSSPVTPSPSSQTPTTLTTSIKTATSYGDIADSTVWVHPTDSSMNLLFVTLEDEGLAIYDHQGKELERLGGIKMLGADIRYSISDGNGESFDLLAVNTPDEEEVSFYQINPNGENKLDAIGRVDIGMEAESICLYKNVTTSALTVTGVAEDGTAKQFKLKYDGNDIINVRNSGGSVRKISVGGELSACIVDDSISHPLCCRTEHWYLGLWC